MNDEKPSNVQIIQSNETTQNDLVECSDTEKNLIEQYIKRREKESVPFEHKVVECERDENGNIPVKTKCIYPDSHMTQQQRELHRDATVCAATGSAGKHLHDSILYKTVSGCYTANIADIATNFDVVLEAMLALAPADTAEGMLCSNIIMLKSQIDYCFTVAACPKTSLALSDINLNRATKLMRVLNETIEALNKYRRKGEQRVTVHHHQHVSVNDGGQAIVNPRFNKGGGDHEK